MEKMDLFEVLFELEGNDDDLTPEQVGDFLTKMQNDGKVTVTKDANHQTLYQANSLDTLKSEWESFQKSPAIEDSRPTQSVNVPQNTNATNISTPPEQISRAEQSIPAARQDQEFFYSEPDTYSIPASPIASTASLSSGRSTRSNSMTSTMSTASMASTASTAPTVQSWMEPPTGLSQQEAYHHDQAINTTNEPYTPAHVSPSPRRNSSSSVHSNTSPAPKPAASPSGTIDVEFSKDYRRYQTTSLDPETIHFVSQANSSIDFLMQKCAEAGSNEKSRGIWEKQLNAFYQETNAKVKLHNSILDVIKSQQQVTSPIVDGPALHSSQTPQIAPAPQPNRSTERGTIEGDFSNNYRRYQTKSLDPETTHLVSTANSKVDYLMQKYREAGSNEYSRGKWEKELNAFYEATDTKIAIHNSMLDASRPQKQVTHPNIGRQAHYSSQTPHILPIPQRNRPTGHVTNLPSPAYTRPQYSPAPPQPQQSPGIPLAPQSPEDTRIRVNEAVIEYGRNNPSQNGKPRFQSGANIVPGGDNVPPFMGVQVHADPHEDGNAYVIHLAKPENNPPQQSRATVREFAKKTLEALGIKLTNGIATMINLGKSHMHGNNQNQEQKHGSKKSR